MGGGGSSVLKNALIYHTIYSFYVSNMKPLPYDEFKRLDVNHIAHDAQHNNSVENLEVKPTISMQEPTQSANRAPRHNPNRFWASERPRTGGRNLPVQMKPRGYYQIKKARRFFREPSQWYVKRNVNPIKALNSNTKCNR